MIVIMVINIMVVKGFMFYVVTRFKPSLSFGTSGHGLGL